MKINSWEITELINAGWREADREELQANEGWTDEETDSVITEMNLKINDIAEEKARYIREADTWDADDCRELCDLAGLADEWDAADGEEFEGVIYKAARILGVEI